MFVRLALALAVMVAVPARAEEPALPAAAVVRLAVQGGGDAALVRDIVQRRLALLDEKGSAPVSAVTWTQEGAAKVATISLLPHPCRGRILGCIADSIVRGEPEPPCTPARLAAWQEAIRDVAARPGVVALSKADASSQRAVRDALAALPAMATATLFLNDRAGVEIEEVDDATAAAAAAQVRLPERRVVWMASVGSRPPRTVVYAVPVAPAVVINHVESAEVRADDGLEPQVMMKLDAEGAEAFGALTAAAVQQILTIEVDGALVSAPVVMEPITGGYVSVLMCNRDQTNAGCLDRAGRFAAVMQGGSLPGPVTATIVEGRCVAP